MTTVASFFDHVFNRLEEQNGIYAGYLARLQLVVDNGQTQTISTDGNYLWVNSSFYDPLSEDEKLFVLAGMAIRLTNNYVDRMKQSKNARLFNIAADYMISQTLIAEGIGEIPGNALYDPRFDGKSLDEIVAHLDKESVFVPISISDEEIDAALAHPKATQDELEAVRAAVSQTIRDATQPLTPRRELDRELGFLTNFGWNGLTDDEVDTLLTALRPITIRLAAQI